MQRQRRARDLEQASQKRSVSGISGGTLHKQLELRIIQQEIKQLKEGVEEYQNVRRGHWNPGFLVLITSSGQVRGDSRMNR